MGVKANIGDVIQPKSNQLNSDDLVTGPLTIKITGTSLYQEAGRNKIAIRFEGDNGKPWKPCTTMARLMATVWNIPKDDDGSALIWHSLTLYRDPSVKWADIAVGGIRISHMDSIDKERVELVTISRGKKEAMIIRPLKDAPVAARTAPPAIVPDKATTGCNALIGQLDACITPADVEAICADEKFSKQRDYLKTNRPELSEKLEAAFISAVDRVSEGGE